MISIEAFLPEGFDLTSIEKPIRVIGIDLGTTNSTVAQIIYDPGSENKIKAGCLEIKQTTAGEGDYISELIPSVVAMKSNSIFIGEGAKRLIQDNGMIKNRNIFYESKNDIGTKKVYHKAPEGFKTPYQISSKVLEFIYDKSKEASNIPIEQTVITVPASFQASQRSDTLTAAGLAGIFSIDSAKLLDEPVAAFIYYILSEENDVIAHLDKDKNFLVFDYGGGTCDVSIFKLKKFEKKSSLEIQYLSVSRFHRLGGGDIDKAIIYDILIPQIIKQNNLDSFEFEFADKTKYIEPQLLIVAEALKKGICDEIGRYVKFDKYDNTDKAEIIKRFPMDIALNFQNRSFKLEKPEISAESFNKLMEDFLDEEFLYHREDEYKILNSIISPVQDAINRADLKKEEIDFCLIVGGSSAIPHVNLKLKEYLENAAILKFEDENKFQTAIALGAAYQALLLKLTGKGIIQNINHDGISIHASNEDLELIPKHSILPYPSGKDYGVNYDLLIPETPDVYPYKLRIEIITSEEKRILFSAVWQIEDDLIKGDRLILNYKMDENQILRLKLSLTSNPDNFYEIEIDNPFTNIVNPNTIRIQIDKLENELATAKFDKEEKIYKILELAKLYSDIRFFEKSIEYYKMILQSSNYEDSSVFFKIANLYGQIGNHLKEDKYYKEGFNKFQDSGFMFNLALSKYKQRLYDDAEECIKLAIETDQESGPYYLLYSNILEKNNKSEESEKYLKNSFDYFNPITIMSDWEIYWYLNACGRMNYEDKIEEVNIEVKKRNLNNKPFISNYEGVLPLKLKN